MSKNNHPHIQALHELYQEETQAFRKVHRMIDLFESIIKTYTVVILSEYIKRNKLSDSAKGLLSQGLRTPSLGTWQLFSRVLFSELQLSSHNWLIDEIQIEFIISDNELNSQLENGTILFPTFDKEKLQQLKSERKKRKSNFDDVIALRNYYAHGATPTDAQCEADIKKFEPFLTQIIASKWLSASSLEVRDNKVNLVASEGELCLHPILLYRNEESAVSFAFFNDIKNDKIGLLNYPLSKHYREKDFYAEFLEHLPLNEWKKSGNNDFYQHIEELTETFKGRTAEREQLLRFVEDKNKGYFSIQGNPGIGKSALIAQFFKDLRVNEKLKQIQVVEYFIHRGTAQANTDYLLNYLIKRTDELFPQGMEIRAEDKNTWSLQQQLFSKWRLWAEHSKGNKLLFLIDGLDEGVEDDIIKYLPRENFENVLIIYGSRPGGHRSIDELWSALPTEYHTTLELSGLSKQDIRALIYEVANKYSLERESTWIDAVEKRSQGNPLYLKLLCDALENGSIALNDIKAIPKEINQFYKEIIGRYAKDILDGDALLAGLYTFAAAKDYLTMAHLGLINKLGEAQVERVGSTLKEVLYENPLTEEGLDYQLFHESFREYLMDPTSIKIKENKNYTPKKSFEYLKAEERIIDFCATWKDLEGTIEQRYALGNYAAHLSESKKEMYHKELLALFQNDVYTTTQKKVLKQFDATKKLYQLGLLKAGDIKENNAQLEAALCLVDLKYEEENDASQIVALVANNEIDLALKRIESFGGIDKEEVQRKFILYMLCLMELTLLDSKEKSYRKTAIERLLNHLDEQIPPDISIINWNDFFPSYLMFQMACEWSALGLDYLILYKRTEDWDHDWISEKGPYIDRQFKVLLTCASGISHDFWKSDAFMDITTELAKQGKVEEALTCASGISSDWKKSSALTEISTELAKQGKLDEALAYAMEIIYYYNKAKALKDISTELAKQGKVEEAASVMQEAYDCATSISDESDKSSVLRGISSELAKQGKVEEALKCVRKISDDDLFNSKCFGLKDISAELVKQGKVEEAASAMQEALTCARGISNDYWKSLALKDISFELAKQDNLDEALVCLMDIKDDYEKSNAFMNISAELAKLGKTEDAESMIQDALECARGISDVREKCRALNVISTEIVNQGNLEKATSAIQDALSCVRGISDEFDKSSGFLGIVTELSRQGKFEEAFECAKSIPNNQKKSEALKFIFAKLAKDGKIKETAFAMQKALVSNPGIHLRSQLNAIQKEISLELSENWKDDEIIENIRIICNEDIRNNTLVNVLIRLARKNRIEISLNCAQGIKGNKFYLLSMISSELKRIGRDVDARLLMEEAIDLARLIDDPFSHNDALMHLASELSNQGDLKTAKFILREAISEAINISFDNTGDNDTHEILFTDIIIVIGQLGFLDEFLFDSFDSDNEFGWSIIGLSFAYIASSTRQRILGNINEADLEIKKALGYARSLNESCSKRAVILKIFSELSIQGKVEEAASVMQEALIISRSKSDKSDALKDISVQLAKQGNWVLAETTGLEIPQLAERQSCWKTIAHNTCKEMGWVKALQQANQFKNDEAQLFYLKGWAEALSHQETNTVCVQAALSQLVYDSESIETLLQKHAINQLFFGDASKEQINRLNKTLNIQWAMDIKAQFPSKEEIQRLSTNIEEWLHEIADEDLRDKIEFWAFQVAHGKWTEEKFQERLKEKL